MCLYSLLQTPCSHGECQIALSIYKNSESYTKNGFQFPTSSRFPSGPLPSQLYQEHRMRGGDQNPNPESIFGVKQGNKIGSSKSLIQSDKQDRVQMLKVLNKIRKDIRELKRNQTIIIERMDVLQQQWREQKKPRERGEE